MNCAQMAEDIDMIAFAYDKSHVSQNVKIWLTLVDPFLPQFFPKVTHTLFI